ncbi:MAG: class I SAM-dependent methyltransferase [Promethearchaeota archaeon]
MSKDRTDLNAEAEPIPFTARLIALHRAIESKRKDALFTDPFAERLAGDMSEYREKHRRTAAASDAAVVRTYFIDQTLLEPWCKKHIESQIVILGAGLDARAYRFLPLRNNTHTVFEIDFEVVNNYKARKLKDETPLCILRRVSTDLARTDLTEHLLKSGYSKEIPTFWILEGLVYYLPRNIVLRLLKALAELSADDSMLFADVCNPGLAELDYGAFTRHFEWGIDMEEIPALFSSSGWDVSASYLDDHDHGRDVGQRGLMLVHGKRKDTLEFWEYTDEEAVKAVSTESVSDPHLRDFALKASAKSVPDIEEIIQLTTENLDAGLKKYIQFLRNIESAVRRISSALSDPISLGQISPRLLKSPLSTGIESEEWSTEEVESHMIGYLRAIISLLYCGIKGLEGWQFSDTPVQRAGQSIRSVREISDLLEFIKRTSG